MRRSTLKPYLCGLGFLFLLSVSLLGQPIFSEGILARQYIFGNSNLGFGARAMAMGGAFTALADDITAMNYNPAGLAQIIKIEFSAGANYGGISGKYPGALVANDYWTSIEMSPANLKYNQPGFDYVGIAVPLKIGIPIVLGLAYQNRISNTFKPTFDNMVTYTGNLEYPAFSTIDESRREYGNTGVQSTATVSLGIRPLDFLCLGANINIHNMNLNDSLRYRDLYTYYEDGAEFAHESYELIFDDQYKIKNAISYDLGILLKMDILSFGVVYKREWSASLINTWSYDETSIDYQGTVTNDVAGDAWNGKLYWPTSINAGISIRPIDALTLSFDYNYSKWSAGRIVWDLDIEPWGFPVFNPQNTQVLRAGMEYLAFIADVAIPIRLGGFRDKFIGLDASSNKISFWGATFGTGIAAKNSVLDIAAIYHFGSYDSTPVFTDVIVSSKVSQWRVIGSLTFRLGK